MRAGVLALCVALAGATTFPVWAEESEQDAAAAQTDNATIDQTKGIDQSVDYASLRHFGPWDDRNYELTAADIALLPKDDEYRREHWGHGRPEGGGDAA